MADMVHYAMEQSLQALGYDTSEMDDDALEELYDDVCGYPITINREEVW